jgi:hypothetical protein
MSILEKTINGVTTKVDLTPVEEIKDTMDKILRERTSRFDRRHIGYSSEILKQMIEMDNEQLRYLANNFVGLLFKYADLYQYTIDEPEAHLKFVENYRIFKKMCEKTLKKSQ